MKILILSLCILFQSYVENYKGPRPKYLIFEVDAIIIQNDLLGNKCWFFYKDNQLFDCIHFNDGLLDRNDGKFDVIAPNRRFDNIINIYRQKIEK